MQHWAAEGEETDSEQSEERSPLTHLGSDRVADIDTSATVSRISISRLLTIILYNNITECFEAFLNQIFKNNHSLILCQTGKTHEWIFQLVIRLVGKKWWLRMKRALRFRPQAGMTVVSGSHINGPRCYITMRFLKKVFENAKAIKSAKPKLCVFI